jgi:hypothetical protein
MKRLAFIIVVLFVNSFPSYSQTDLRPVVGVSKFTIETETKYSSAVTSKIIEMLTQSKRFQVVDRTSYDKVKDELEFQKTEAFIDSKERAKQGVALAAQYLITGHIVKMNVYAFKNPDGSVNGYKASTSFQLKVVDVETGKSTEAQSFQSKVSDVMLSPESAVNEAVKSLEPDLANYFANNFPVVTKIAKIITTKKDAAVAVLIVGGKTYGLKEGDKLKVNRIEMIEGKPYPSEIGEIKITKVAGDDFSECSVVKGGTDILAKFNAAENLSCKLQIK